MMHHQHPLAVQVAVQPAEGLLEEGPPGIGVHEHGVLAAPVVVGTDHVGVQILHDELHVFQPEFGDDLDEPMHLLRIQQKVHQRILEGHQHVQLLKDAGAYDGHGQIPLRDLRLVLPGGLPAPGAVGPQIGRLHIALPFLDIPDHLVFRRDDGDGRRLILGKGNIGPPPVIGIGAAHPISPDELENGIAADGPKRCETDGQPVRMPALSDGLQQIVFRT